MSLPETVEVHKLTVLEFHALEPFLDPGRRLLRYLAPEYHCHTFVGTETPLSPQAYPDVAIDVGALFA